MAATGHLIKAGRILADILALGLACLAIYVAGFGVFDNAVVSGGTVTLGLVVGFLSILSADADERRRPGWRLRAVVDLVLAVIFVWVAWHWLQVMLEQEEFFIEFEQSDYVIGWVGFVIIGWASYRFFGMPMFVVYVLAAVYVLFGDWFPWIFKGAAEDWTRVSENLWYSTDGTFGRPVEVVSRVVLIFIVFGAVLQSSGAGAVLLKLAFAATGRFAGGPAHASIVGSALFGTMSGAAVANVVSTGIFTIPIIRKAGFSRRFSGAVEAAASTGGQIMPPVMGVVAFLMSDVTGIPYIEIIAAALIPAAFFYASLFVVVLIEARRQGVKATPAAERERLSRQDYVQSLAFFIPLAVIIAVLLTGRTPQSAGFAALVSGFVLCLILFPDFRSPRRILEALVSAGKVSATLMIIVAAIGLVIGVINMTGVGLKFAQAILAVSGDDLLISLILVMIGCLVLGMGVPSGAAYLIIALVMGPALQQLGLPTILAHLFVVYFGVLSAVTPPVALAAFAAAPIAGSKPMETGIEAVRLAVAGFLIPYIFVYHPSVVLILGFDPLGLVWAIAVFAISTWSIATGLGGYEARRLAAWERAVRIVAGVAVLAPVPVYAGPAAVVVVILIARQRFKLGVRPQAG